ncbi:uncharacterized protein C8A04DRAFT_15048 [Dichotomopilus funicola]|uniref:Uncharacterized protein n=1 Tax=Dichotomopilus funicola TaxID=1934379 RepID=A0AAN6UWZ8_9PEZI|nr:hypothetical protein C8A04DRAFT_15048 [Dichotomopilus funicola]
MERKKIVHALDTPYSAVEWPHISQDDQDTILELLCQLLAPIGAHRESFITPSKGKRKRVRKANNPAGSGTEKPVEPIPPSPPISAHVDVGLSVISRGLQAMSREEDNSPSGPSPSSTKNTTKIESKTPQPPPPIAEPGSRTRPPPYSIVFVARSGQSSAFHCHFPQMVALASQTQQPTNSNPDPAIRLVGFSRACEDRLSAALGVPRVSSVALRAGAESSGPEGVSQARGLVEFVRERVAPVDVAWLREEGGVGKRKGGFLETRIEAVPTKVGVKKVKAK